MKYRMLTKEQMHELHEEFSRFLATQQIDAKEWEQLKKEKPEIVQQEMELFSDLVWEKALQKTTYLEHISEKDINLFKCTSKEIIRIYIKQTDLNFSFLNDANYKTFLNNPLQDSIEYYKAVKSYSKDRNEELFSLIEMGAVITNGELFTSIQKLIG